MIPHFLTYLGLTLPYYTVYWLAQNDHGCGASRLLSETSKDYLSFLLISSAIEFERWIERWNRLWWFIVDIGFYTFDDIGL